MTTSKIRVPQESGELRVAIDGGEPRTWRVQDHLVTAADDAERDRLLVLVDGSKVEDGPSATQEPPDSANLQPGASPKDKPPAGG